MTAVPVDCWYAVGFSADVSAALLPVAAVNRSVVLFRTSSGAVAALDDCCVHRPYPLSLGALVGDVVRCGLCGFEYDAAGRCVRVPTQPRVPVGASVRTYPVAEAHGLVWLWLGEPGRAALHRIPELPWLDDPAWTSLSGQLGVAAGFLLLHESFADVTKIPVLAPEIAPDVLATTPPPLEVVVSETTVSLARTYPPTRLPAWQARALGTDEATPFGHRQYGEFLSPAVWVDHWDVAGPGVEARLRFTQLVTPVTAAESRLTWILSRDFALDDDETGKHLAAMFESYYPRLAHALEITQSLLDAGRTPAVNVAADVAALKVREIVRALLAEERQR
jgi:vanillate O-demethylase monooxygenase subunit